MLIFEGKMVDLSPGSDHSVGAVLVRPMKTILWEHDPTLSVPCMFTREPLWNERKGSCCDVDNSLRRFWEIEKSGTDREDRLVLTEEERLALNKVKDSLEYKNGRYRVAVPWKDDKPELPDTKPMASVVSPPKHRKKIWRKTIASPKSVKQPSRAMSKRDIYERFLQGPVPQSLIKLTLD